MVTILKALIILGAFVIFTYSAALALQGELSMERILEDSQEYRSNLEHYFRAIAP